MNMAFNYKKSIQAVNFFAKKEGGKIDKMKAVKLVWLSDRLHVRTYARMITNDRLYALPYGTVPSQTLDFINNRFGREDEIQKYRSSHINLIDDNIGIVSVGSLDENVFSDSDIEIMEKVFSDFGKYSSVELSDISHYFPEWERHKDVLESKKSRQEAVEIEDLFKNISHEVNFPTMNESEEILALSKEIFFSK